MRQVLVSKFAYVCKDTEVKTNHRLIGDRRESWMPPVYDADLVIINGGTYMEKNRLRVPREELFSTRSFLSA